MKAYNEYCPIAHALDLVGDRWALLVVRELNHGPLRYSDLRERLPRCSTNVLATRLKDLESGGVVARRRLPPPAASNVYELTEAGEGLQPVLAALARWGAQTLGPPPADAELHVDWLERALRTAVVASAPTARVAFEIGEERASLIDGVVSAGISEEAEAIVTGTPAGFYALVVLGETSDLGVTGDAGAVASLAEALQLARTSQATVA
ncbi:helix-turn-helix domain-containing protein [Gaiella sp.]|uniref:winged helix-turn-helix transcriptional regulator n=1 Tax=Gaiella sp. TaxID=2663207 RepID=UPI0032677FED